MFHTDFLLTGETKLEIRATWDKQGMLQTVETHIKWNALAKRLVVLRMPRPEDIVTTVMTDVKGAMSNGSFGRCDFAVSGL